MKKVFLYIALFAAFLTTGCSSFVEGYDVSPNSPSEVTPNMLLTNAEVGMFAIYGGQMARTSAMWTQQIEGVDAQMFEYGRYNLLEGDITNEWDLIHSETLDAAIDLVNNFGADNPHYGGMGKVLQAMAFAVSSDLWGDVPFSEVAQGLQGNFNPDYEDQEAVFEGIQDLLTSAITDLEKDPTGIAPAGDDLIYGGDVDAWKKLAYTLKARYALRLSKVDASAASTALANLAMGFTSSSDDAMMVFGTNGNEANTWSTFDIARPDYIKMGETFVGAMVLSGDPRLPFYATTDTSGVAYRGAALGSGDVTASAVGTWLKGSTLPMVSYVEAKFIEAEANLGTDDQAAADAYNEAVKASVLQVTGAPDAVFEALFASETDQTITMQKIQAQKYVAMFGQIEVYNDWRRTDWISLPIHPNAANGLSVVPVRWPTPIEERLYNSNAPKPSYTLVEKVWWDQ